MKVFANWRFPTGSSPPPQALPLLFSSGQTNDEPKGAMAFVPRSIPVAFGRKRRRNAPWLPASFRPKRWPI